MKKHFENLCWLFFAHGIGDLALQPEYVGKWKYINTFYLMGHIFIWTGCICICLLVFKKDQFWKFLMLFLWHGVIDQISSNLPYWWTSHLLEIRGLDQLGHTVQLLLVYFL